MEPLVGESAAIGTALCFAVSSMLFTLAGRRAGASIVNRSRLLVAALLVVAIHWTTRGSPVPMELSWTVWAWLSVSGILGLALGDDLLFRAYVVIGPALSMLIFASSPAFAALLSWIFLGEALTPFEMGGVALTLAGIGWVVTARKRQRVPTGRRGYVVGLLLALGGAVGQALGLLTAKLGLNEGASPQAANWIRLMAAVLAVWFLTAVTGHARKSLNMWKDEGWASGFTVLGAVFGPIAGVWLSLVAIDRAPIGIASTLMSLTPLFLLPMSWLVFREPMTIRALLGTSVALAGVAILLT